MYFFDTYALVEMAKGNKNYEKYSKENIRLSVFNLVEFFYSVLNDFDEQTAKKEVEKLNYEKLEVTDEIIEEACRFRHKNKPKKLSYADCIGYALAKQHNLKFLTGDMQFRGMENVEFVK